MADSVAVSAEPTTPAIWRQSKWLALVEFTVVALIFLADYKHLIPVSETPFLLIVGWISCGCVDSPGATWDLTGTVAGCSLLALGIGAGTP